MIDITKQYSTRDGRPVRLLCTDGPRPGHPVIGIIGCDDFVCHWTLEGGFCFPEKDDFDLIEVKFKVVIEKWGTVYKYKGESEVYVEWFYVPSDSLGSIYNERITVLARAVHFRWEGEGV